MKKGCDNAACAEIRAQGSTWRHFDIRSIKSGSEASFASIKFDLNRVDGSGFRPVASRWIRTPKAHISIAVVTQAPSDTSGA